VLFVMAFAAKDFDVLEALLAKALVGSVMNVE
jgi:hypothetical protein